MRYAYFNPASGQVLNWLDTDEHDYPALPPAEMLLEVSKEHYEDRDKKRWHVAGGKLVEGEAPAAAQTAPNPDDQARSVRARRNQLLADSDHVVLRALEQGAPIPHEWKAYRQKLRDLTDAKKFPKVAEKDWPVAPATPE